MSEGFADAMREAADRVTAVGSDQWYLSWGMVNQAAYAVVSRKAAEVGLRMWAGVSEDDLADLRSAICREWALKEPPQAPDYAPPCFASPNVFL